MRKVEIKFLTTEDTELHRGKKCFYCPRITRINAEGKSEES